MASHKSYSITLSNNRTEKAAIDYVMSADPTLLNPSRESRKYILELLELPSTSARAFDLVQVPGHVNSEDEITAAEKSEITLVELKTTQKFLPNSPGYHLLTLNDLNNLIRTKRTQFQINL